jgi:predicted NodU family carbamoyl transferase
VVRDGKLIAAAEEERFRRVKHWAGFPAQALAYWLSDVNHIALNQDTTAPISYKWASGSPEFGDLFSPAFEDLLGPRRSPTDPPAQ